MAQAKKKKSNTKKTTKKSTSTRRTEPPKHVGRIRDEIKAFIFLAIGAFLIFALYVSAAGKLGEFFKDFLLGVMGHIAYILPFILLIYGVLLLFKQTGLRGIRATILLVLLFLMMMLLNAGRFLDAAGSPVPDGSFLEIYAMSGLGKSGGIIGVYVGGLLVSLIGKSGLYIFTVVALIILCILSVNTPISQYIEALNEKRMERRERKYEQWEEEEKQRELDEKLSEKALKVGRKSIPEPTRQQDIEIEGVGIPESQLTKKEIRKPESFTESAPQKSVDTKQPTHKTKLTDKQIAERQKNIMNLAMHDEKFGDQGSGTLASEVAGSEFDLQGNPESDNFDNDIADIPTGMGNIDEANESVGINDSSTKPSSKKMSPSDDPGVLGDPNKQPKTKPAATPSGFTGFAKADEDKMATYKLPPINLLSKGPKAQKTDSAAELKEKARKLEQTLSDFKVEAKVLKVTVGPTVTRYEVQPDIGVKINSIKNLESDLALNLEVKSVRVVPMSSGKVIGIEAYNENTSLVTLRDLIDSSEFRLEDSKIAYALGKNISGHRIIADLKSMPHLLIAGTTGSGKSVCINSILLSILYRATPKEVQLILIDPKVVELKSYNGIPHLAMPVVTDADKAAAALEHTVREMNRRYNQFAEENVRNISAYNEKLRNENRNDEVLPEVVIVIDELADLMLVASQKVQDSISRLAAMARAAGMHLIVATQQPLASILTSVIKANIPSRIAFSVSSNSASRVILDNPGAERLLGNGDMLFHPVGSREAMRIQGAFVTDSEVHKVTDYVKKQASPEYVPDILETLNTETTGKLVDEEDDLYQDAVDTVISAKSASTSMLQRRFRIGYNRAARLMEMLEDRGVVGPQDGSRPRKVLIQEEAIHGEPTTQMQSAGFPDEPKFNSGYDEEDYNE